MQKPSNPCRHGQRTLNGDDDDDGHLLRRESTLSALSVKLTGKTFCSIVYLRLIFE